MKQTIITISREFGSGGHFIGEEVSKRLGIPFYDKNIIQQIAEKTGFSALFSPKTNHDAYRSCSLIFYPITLVKSLRLWYTYFIICR